MTDKNKITLEQWLGEENKIGKDIWEKKYQYNNETFNEWLDRVSGGNKELRQLIKSKKFLFGGRILANRGLHEFGKKITYSNCYVVSPPDDNIESIYKCASNLARTFSYGGGCGVDISNLAPKGAKINNAANETSGAVSFMDTFSGVTSQIGQGGRRGALMISLDCSHPDIEDFINIKNDLDKVTSANISLKLDNEFMYCVENDLPYKVHFTRKETGETIEKKINAKDVFMQLATNNWRTGEPGALFWETICNYNLMSEDDSFKYSSTNPCAEEPLPAGGSCLLGAINLNEFVDKETKQFAWFDFTQAVKIATHALNEVLDEGLPLHPLQEQKDTVKDWRQIGLGIMGLADMLINMGITYGSSESLDLCHKIGRTMAVNTISASNELSKIDGAFPKCNGESITQSDFYKEHFHSDSIMTEDIIKNGLRNSQLLTIAPTGSISTMIGVSGGIEPIFANSYTRTTKSLHNKDTTYKVYTPIVKEYIEEHSLKDDSELPEFFITARDINYINRINMQSVWQSHIDASISSTLNLPEETTPEDIMDIYILAWERGLKGITVFRENCQRTAILSADTSKEDSGEDNKKKKERQKDNADYERSQHTPTDTQTLERGVIINVNDDVIGRKRKLITGCGSLHCVALFDPINGDLMETYLSKGSSGGCVSGDTEYFNGSQWKPISEYVRGSNEQVLQYNTDGTANLTTPFNYIVNENVKYLKQFKNCYGMDMVLSDDHRMYTYKNYRKYSMGMRKKLTDEIMTVSEYLNRDEKKERHIPTTFSFNTKGIPLKDDVIRLLVAIYADGSLTKKRVVISLKKQRKIDRLIKLLDNCDIGYAKNKINNTNCTRFSFYLPASFKEWGLDKQFTAKWFDCNDEQLKIITDEIRYWDGSTEEGNRLGAYYSSKKEEVDFIQFALSRLGYRAVISHNDSPSGSESYRVRWTKQNVHNLKHAKVTDYKTTDNRSYCFTVHSGLLVLRRNGKIFITGNCNNFMVGLSRMISCASRAGVHIDEIIDQLDSTGVCPSYAVRSATKRDTSKGSCCPMAVGNALRDMYNEVQDELFDSGEYYDKNHNEVEVKTNKIINNTNKIKEELNKLENVVHNTPCPECGEDLIFEGGCNICKACGWSKCD